MHCDNYICNIKAGCACLCDNCTASPAKIPTPIPTPTYGKCPTCEKPVIYSNTYLCMTCGFYHTYGYPCPYNTYLYNTVHLCWKCGFYHTYGYICDTFTQPVYVSGNTFTQSIFTNLVSTDLVSNGS